VSPRRHVVAPSTAASRAARARAKAGGPLGRWRQGRMPELLRCQLMRPDAPRTPCGALVEAGERAAHLAQVHDVPATDAAVAAAFIVNNPAGRESAPGRIEP